MQSGLPDGTIFLDHLLMKIGYKQRSVAQSGFCYVQYMQRAKERQSDVHKEPIHSVSLFQSVEKCRFP